MQTSAAHTAQVMEAVRERIQSLSSVTGPFAATPLVVEIGNPAQFHPLPEAAAPPLVTVWPYLVEFANAAYLATPDTAQALNLHTLITPFCTAGATPEESAGTFELRILAHVIRLFLERPQLGPVRILNAPPVGPAGALIASDIFVTAHPKSLDLEDINHLWMMQGDVASRTSVAYVYSFAIVTPSQPGTEGPPVLRAVLEDPLSADPNDLGVRPEIPQPPADPAVDLGTLAVQVGTPAAPVLVPEVTFPAGGGAQTLALIAVTEVAQDLMLTLESWDAPAGLWQDVSARLGGTALTSQARAALQDGAPLDVTDVTLADDPAAGVLRLTAGRAIDPETLSISRVMITMEAGP